MLVLSKLTNINHASGGSYDPPLFLYSALFAARGRFGGLPRTAAGFGGLPRTAAALAGLPRTAAGFGGLPRTAAGFGGLLCRRRALAGLPCTAAGFCGASPHGGELWRGFPARRRALAGLPRTAAALAGLPPARLSLPPRYIRLGAGSFFAVFRICTRHTAKASAKISPVILPYFILRRKIQEVC